MSGRLHPGATWSVHAAEAAELKELCVADGNRVKEGEVLLRLESGELEYELTKTELRETTLRAKRAAVLVDQDGPGDLMVLEAELASLAARRDELQAALKRLSPIAPFEGVFRKTDPDVGVGEIVSKREQIGVVYDDASWRVDTYVTERERHLLREGAMARFIPDGALAPALSLRVVSVESDATRELREEMLASEFGGSVRSRMSEGALVPENAIYRVELEVLNTEAGLVDQVRRGTVVVYGDAESIASRIWRQTLSVAWRELGF